MSAASPLICTGVTGGRAVIMRDLAYACGDEPPPYWCAWRALGAGGDLVDAGVIQTACVSPGGHAVLACDPCVAQVEFIPVRNFTPFPAALCRGTKPLGVWYVSAFVSGLGAGERLTLRFPSDSDGGYSAVASLDGSAQDQQRQKMTARLMIESPWSCLQVVREVRGRQLAIDAIELVYSGTGEHWSVFFGASKPEHTGLSGNGRVLVFGEDAVGWSYFTCWPMPT